MGQKPVYNDDRARRRCIYFTILVFVEMMFTGLIYGFYWMLIAGLLEGERRYAGAVFTVNALCGGVAMVVYALGLILTIPITILIDKLYLWLDARLAKQGLPLTYIKEYSIDELIALPYEQRSRIVATLIVRSQNEDFEVFEAYSEEDFDPSN